jgi:hypothetical protein
MADDTPMPDVPDSTTEATLSAIQDYDVPSHLALTALSPTFVPCPFIRLNIDFKHLGYDPDKMKEEDDNQCDEIKKKFRLSRQEWIGSLRLLPRLDELEKVSLYFGAKFFRVLGGQQMSKDVAGKFVYEITEILWDAVGRVKGLKVVIEGCEDAEERREVAKRVRGFDVLVDAW